MLLTKAAIVPGDGDGLDVLRLDDLRLAYRRVLYPLQLISRYLYLQLFLGLLDLLRDLQIRNGGPGLQNILFAAFAVRVAAAVVVEPAITRGTGVGSLARMDEDVFLKRLESAEVLWAILAMVLGLARMRSQVVGQGVSSRKRSRAILADVWPLLSMRAHVHL